MRRKPLARDIQLRFSGSRAPLSFSQVREFYLQAHGWTAVPTGMQRERLESMQGKFQRLNGLFGRIDSGEQIKKVAASAGVSAEALEKWHRGRALPRLISPAFIQFSVQKRFNHLKGAAFRNPRIGYVLGARMSGHLSVQVDKRGGASIVSSSKKGTIEHELRKAQSEIFGYRLKSKTRVLRRNGVAVSLAGIVRASSVEVAGFLNKATFFGEQIPFEFLKNKGARRQFAMALIDANAFPLQRNRSSRKKQETGIIFQTRNRNLRDYLSKLLSEFRIKNNPRSGPILSKKEAWAEFKKGKLFQKSKSYGLFIPRADLEKFRKQIGFRDPAKAQMLNRIILQS